MDKQDEMAAINGYRVYNGVEPSRCECCGQILPRGHKARKENKNERTQKERKKRWLNENTQ